MARITIVTFFSNAETIPKRARSAQTPLSAWRRYRRSRTYALDFENRAYH